MNCLTGHPKMTKKEQTTPITTVKTTIRHKFKNRPSKVAHRGGLPRLSQKHKCDASRLLLGVQYNLLARL